VGEDEGKGASPHAVRYYLDAEGYDVERSEAAEMRGHRLKERGPEPDRARGCWPGLSGSKNCAAVLAGGGLRPNKLPIIMLTARAEESGKR